MSRNILVVEDEMAIREMLTFVLEQNGFNAIEAEDYNFALEKIVEPYPDLILLDLYLPDFYGYEILDEIEELNGFDKVSISILTGSRNKKDVEKYDRYSNLVKFIKKPLLVLKSDDT